MNGDLRYSETDKKYLLTMKPYYLQSITDQDLSFRLYRLLDNIAVFDWLGNFYFQIPTNGLRNTYLDAVIEANNRGIDVLNIRAERIKYYESNMKHFDLNEVKKIYYNIKDNKFLVKYTSPEYIDFWKNGNVRIKLSSTYSTGDINLNLRDNEDDIVYKSEGAKIVDVVTRKEIKSVDNTITAHYPSYYLISYSLSLNPKLFILFGYDSCLIIMNPSEYIKSIKDCIYYSESNVKVSYNKIAYVDEYRPPEFKKLLCFRKKLVYQYEDEVRVVVEYFNERDNFKEDRVFYLDKFNMDTRCLYCL
jgi:hypothetical protein